MINIRANSKNFSADVYPNEMQISMPADLPFYIYSCESDVVCCGPNDSPRKDTGQKLLGEVQAC